MIPVNDWKDRLLQKDSPSILATGAKRWENSVEVDFTKHLPSGLWFGTDIEAGDGVDIVGDLQSLHKSTSQKFDGIWCVATLEHIERPWCAMHAMSQLLSDGGCLYLETHHTFPLHYYPDDYFRFSTSALKTLAFDSGLKTTSEGYLRPCTIIPPEEIVWNPHAEAFLNVAICAVK